MKRATHVIALLVVQAAFAMDAAAVDLSGVRFKAGEPGPGRTLQDSVESDFWLRTLGKTPEILKQHPDLHFEVIGHAGADECQREECDTLALRRAVLTYRYLLDAGVDPRQLSTLKSVGAKEPIADQPLLPELNRRAEINVTFDSMSPSIPAPTRTLTVDEVEASLGSLHGKVVSIGGFAHVRLEDNLLCPSQKKQRPDECLWLDFQRGGIVTDEEWERYVAEYSKLQRSYDREWVVVRGVLDARGSGHLGFAFGNFNVQAIQLREASE